MSAHRALGKPLDFLLLHLPPIKPFTITMGLPSHIDTFSESNPDPATPAGRGRRTTIATLYRRAELEPNKLFGSFPLTDNIEDGFRDFTFAELAKAVDTCAWNLKETFGTSEQFEAILSMGSNDYRYIIFFYAAIKCGFQVKHRRPSRVRVQYKLTHSHRLCSSTPDTLSKVSWQ